MRAASRTILLVIPCLVAAPAAAQVELGVAGGVAFPQGDLADVADTGWQVTGVMNFGVAPVPVGLRLELGWAQLPLEFGDPLDGPDIEADYRQFYGTVDAVLSMAGPGVTPYLIGGGGLYQEDVDSDDESLEFDDETSFGVNGGVGLRIPFVGFDAFVEARLHH
ncbi:MAG: outer membrane beta-barrel protein, partial [Longimicrobiales bacterium]